MNDIILTGECLNDIKVENSSLDVTFKIKDLRYLKLDRLREIHLRYSLYQTNFYSHVRCHHNMYYNDSHTSLMIFSSFLAPR